MGIDYESLIREISEAQKKSGISLEDYLKQNEEDLKNHYCLGDLLFYMNLTELLRRENVVSDYFKEKNTQAHEEDLRWNGACFRLCSSDSVECICIKK